jgi:protein TonB
MLAYTASRPAPVDRRPHPNAMLAIIAAHVAVVAAVMSAKMEFDRHRPPPPLVIETIPLPKPPPISVPHSIKPQTNPAATPSTPTGPQPLPHDADILTGPTAVGPGPLGPTPVPQPTSLPQARLSNSVAQLLTPASDLKPPYPPSKLLNEEETVLRLRLTVDEHGRVVAVDPVGRTDPIFLEAARKHLMTHWRYRPAVQDGQAVASTAVITLRFELDG